MKNPWWLVAALAVPGAGAMLGGAVVIPRWERLAKPPPLRDVKPLATVPDPPRAYRAHHTFLGDGTLAILFVNGARPELPQLVRFLAPPSFAPARPDLTLPSGSSSAWLSRDGKLLALVADHQLAIQPTDGGPRRFAIPVDNLDHLALSPDGALVAFTRNERPQAIEVYSVADGTLRGTLDGPQLVDELAVTPDGRMLVAMALGGVARWDLPSLAPRPALPLVDENGQAGDNWAGALSPRGDRIAAPTGSGRYYQFDLAHDGLVFRGHRRWAPGDEGGGLMVYGPRSALAAAWSVDDRLYVANDGTLTACDVETGRPRASVRSVVGVGQAVAVSPDGALVAVPSAAGDGIDVYRARDLIAD